MVCMCVARVARVVKCGDNDDLQNVYRLCIIFAFKAISENIHIRETIQISLPFSAFPLYETTNTMSLSLCGIQLFRRVNVCASFTNRT